MTSPAWSTAPSTVASTRTDPAWSSTCPRRSNTDAQPRSWSAPARGSPPPIDVDSDRRRLLLVDEAWALLAHAATTRWLQQVSKLARARGVQLITVIHRLSDLAAQTDAGTAAQRPGPRAARRRRNPRHLRAGAQRTRRRHRAARPHRARSRPGHQPRPYRALWRIGEHTAVVDHILTAAEAARWSTPTPGCGHDAPSISRVAAGMAAVVGLGAGVAADRHRALDRVTP